MTIAMKFLLTYLVALSFSLTAETTAVSKEQTACTMCYSCDNPCHPLPLPPPSLPECPPPPPPPSPPPPLPECPPPPAEECPSCIPIPQYVPPPPRVLPHPGPPFGGQFYGPPSPGYSNNPVPYFPDDYDHPYPKSSSSAFNSLHLKTGFVVFASIIALSALSRSM